MSTTHRWEAAGAATWDWTHGCRRSGRRGCGPSPDTARASRGSFQIYGTSIRPFPGVCGRVGGGVLPLSRYTDLAHVQLNEGLSSQRDQTFRGRFRGSSSSDSKKPPEGSVLGMDSYPRPCSDRFRFGSVVSVSYCASIRNNPCNRPGQEPWLFVKLRVSVTTRLSAAC